MIHYLFYDGKCACGATVCREENGDAATCNDEKTFAFIFCFSHFAGVNYVHLYVCTWSFRRNKICTHPRAASHSLTRCNRKIPTSLCASHIVCAVICAVWGMCAQNFNPILRARISVAFHSGPIQSEYCKFSPFPSDFTRSLNWMITHERKVSKLCGPQLTVRNRGDYTNNGHSIAFTIYL